jgi:hypothetical protein
MKMPKKYQKKYFDSLKTNKPCDGFEIVKTSKAKAVLIAPLLALSGWIVLIYLIAKR